MKKNSFFMMMALFLMAFMSYGQTTTTYELGVETNLTETSPGSGILASADGKIRTPDATTNYHSSGYGYVFKGGNILELDVASGNTTVRFYGSVHSNGNMDGGTISGGSDLGSHNVKVTVDKTGTYEYTYLGGATTLYFAFTGSDAYTPKIEVVNTSVTVVKTQVWDFGAEQLDAFLYDNMLDEAAINTWYPGVAPGTSGENLPESFDAGLLNWTGKPSSDRLRTTNTNLTRTDENINGVTGYTGRIYQNGASSSMQRLWTINLDEDDEITIFMLAQNGVGELHFENTTAGDQNDVVTVGATLQEINFVAKSAGTFKIYDPVDKPSYYRILRKPAEFVTVAVSIDEAAAAGIPSGYTLDFTNRETGKVFSEVVSSGSCNVALPIGHSYDLSLGGANGYVISSGLTFDATNATTTHDVTVAKVDLHTLTGSITGLTDLSKLTLTYEPDPSVNTVYSPIVSINTSAATYSVDLESGVAYTIISEGVDDYQMASSTITITSAQTTDIDFTAKPLYTVDINTPDLDATQHAALELTFTNLNDNSYAYSFTDVDAVALRDGVYTVSYSGLDVYALELALTANLTVNGANTSTHLTFNPVTNWSFDDKDIVTSDTHYKGLVISGVKNEVAKGHLVAGNSNTIEVPMNPGDKMIVSYYYQANFTIEGGTPVIGNSNSTSLIERVEYMYTETTAGTVTLNVLGTTYFTNIQVTPAVAFADTITVGSGKDYLTIKEALAAIAEMDRPNDERVTVLIDPGNYEEMLVINVKNVTLKNASSSPSIAILNKGVDIDANAVRITSYYGQKYNFYSQGPDNKWSAEALAVNKANGYTNYENKEGTGGGSSYWNATVVVAADGFTAENIILENSFNQYISLKESQDVVEAKNSASEPVRPTDYGNTDVQDRSKGYVTQAAAIGIANNTDKVTLNNCRVIGRQDTFYGGTGSRVVVYKGAMMGAVDYIFGGMTAVFYQTDFVLNTSDYSSDAAYITAAQQDSGRGYLMYQCHVKSTIPGVETASQHGSKPGYFGRPWRANTSEVVFLETTIDASTYPGSEGLSLINPVGWTSSLGGESDLMYEYGTIEQASVDNSGSRASWSTMLTTPVLKDGTDAVPFEFTKGNDNWDPIGAFVLDVTNPTEATNTVQIKGYKGHLYIANVKSHTKIEVYNITGAVVKTFSTATDRSFQINNGIYIIKVKDADGVKVVKVLAH
ncbi:T9SS type A sorting domain-containing protein [Tamlana sp. s12]|uniref:pectinesterase family protein n=1 Tax=Tamlana sp. s12 TaxID=1630406 RepID=UPI0009ECD085|nr:pectinesterase family protein [Tamlana sp. s12]QQY82325.1 T9SS type A sorting domain-containing protein [Tamlana sp. s12]